MGRDMKAGRSRRPAPIEDEPRLGLDDVIRQRLDMPGKNDTRSWAEILADKLIETAAGGDMKAFDVLGRRVGSAPEAVVPPLLDIDDETARKLLEVVRGPVKPRTSD